MKVRESGMPEADYWETLFDIPLILVRMGIDHTVGDAVEFGVGYGTFAIPAARRIRGTLHGLDLDPAMLAHCRARADAEGLGNLKLVERDFAVAGTGLPTGSVDCAMLFNILHGENPLALLREAHRVLRPGGRAGIIHWNYDPATPRGPPMAIRPRPEQIRAWCMEAGLRCAPDVIPLPPHHYGVPARKDDIRSNSP